LEVDKKLPLTLQTQHQFHTFSLVSYVAKSKIQAKVIKKPICPHKRRHLGIFSLIKKVPNTKVDSHILLGLVHIDGIDQNRSITSHPYTIEFLFFQTNQVDCTDFFY